MAETNSKKTKPKLKISNKPAVAEPSIAVAEPSRAEPSAAMAEPSVRIAEPSRAEPSRAEPSRAEPSSARAKKHTDKNLHDLYHLYLKNVTKSSPNEELELEVKFGTLGFKTINRINYDNVMKKLLASGFTVDENVYLLRIQNEYMDLRTGAPRLSNLRTEINGLQHIRHCLYPKSPVSSHRPAHLGQCQ